MRRNILSSLTLTTAFILFFAWGCTKIDTTTLGSGLIPAVDNVNTFADTLSITGTQGIFNDTTRMVYTDLHPLGAITNDPVFGKTNADLYLQLKPNFFPFYFGNKGDTINTVLNANTGFDSVVLCLSFSTFYGDSTLPQSLSVYKLPGNTANFKDSSYRLDFLPDMGPGNMIGSAPILPTDARGFTFFKGSRKDSINSQVRIKLDPSFLQELTNTINRDTSSTSSGIYRSDSLFKEQMKGFKIVADGGIGNGLFYIDVTNAATRLEVHYRSINKNVIDTNFSTFNFSIGLNNSPSAQATHFARDRSGAEISLPQADALYLQTTPGSFATLNIPGLSLYNNRIIHNAEIVVEQIPSAATVDKVMAPPSYLYLDLVDTPSTASKFKPIYFDLNPSVAYYPDDSTYFYPNGGIDYSYFGSFARTKADGAGVRYYYTFNVSRYVQHIVTNHAYNYPLRLYSPAKLFYSKYVLTYNNLIGQGRIKIGNGNNANYKMYMRVVYSKI